ncbi:hypothetical protein AV521_36905 [Streptomyces sp. IMTB 2501]|uniref:hypothetical protein n=1 Tax=Streptomyces sp. IMTB 2501 TaxID=1776340 RepID=UPI00096E97EA|nr:hypothetical protein [Streptomyces sp. IMTB 2501]OLZ64105.1 hypothetical protein AV521_36905 [Streptomyces sp. IMTB 2501]
MSKTDPRTPNDRLRELIRESDWTYEALARAVNTLGATSGLRLRYDRTTVAHWVRGACPRPPVPELAAEAFSRKLGRTVTVEDTGLAPPGTPGAALPGASDPAASLGELRKAHLDPVLRESMRRTLLAEGWPSTDWADDGGPGGTCLRGPVHLPPTAGPSWRIGASEVDALEAMGRFYHEVWDAFGGGHGTSALAACLADDVAVWLRSPMANGVRTALMSSAAELTLRLALMHFENGHYGFAQRYVGIAAQLARGADDRTMYVTILARAATLALDLGQYRKAAHLADSAQVLLTACAPDTVSFAQGEFAMAYAAVDDVRAAHRCLDATQQNLSRCTTSEWQLAVYHWQRAQVLAFHHRPGKLLPLLRTSLRHVPPTDRRFRAVLMLSTAHAQLRLGRLEEGCATLRRLLTEFSLLRSADMAGGLQELLRQVGAFGRARSAIDLLEQARGLLPQGPAPARPRPYGH